MASSVTLVESTGKGLQKIKATIIAHTDGVVTGVATAGTYNGKVERLITDPDGSSAPSADWDLTITDDDGYDVLAGAGTDRHTSNTEQVLGTSLGIVKSSTLTVAASGMGSGGKAVVYLYLR